MLINTLEAKEAHPLAARIPKRMWNIAFSGKLDERFIPDDTKQIDDITQADLPHFEAANYFLPVASCAVLILRYQDASGAKLLEISRKIGIEDKDIFITSASLGRLDILQSLVESYDQLRLLLIQDSYFESLRGPSREGHHAILQWFKEMTTPNHFNSLVRAHGSAVVGDIISNGHSAALQWLQQAVYPAVWEEIEASYPDVWAEVATNEVASGNELSQPSIAGLFGLRDTTVTNNQVEQMDISIIYK
jgi:hypothetical protein